MTALSQRRIVLGVTGGIAAYKSADLARRLVEAGAEVQVVMTAGAQRFITPLTLQAVSGRAVRRSLWDEAAELGMGHIELARWAELVLIAPATADCIARLAQGRADDLLTTLCLATAAPLVLAPAMNHHMWAHPATRENVRVLTDRGASLLGPATGALAEGETGPGRMLEPLDIRAQVAALFDGGPLAGRSVLVTAGPTREALDPVRFLSNHSTGRMGYAVAAACAAAGAQVTLVSGPTALATPARVRRIDVESAAQMFEAVMAQAAQADILVAAAAVADYRPAQVATDKIKKSDTAMAVTMERTRDIIATVTGAYPALFTVGFAAETRDLEAQARAKRERKGLSMLAGNLVGGQRGFGAGDTELYVCWDGGDTRLGPATKAGLAKQLVDLIAAHCGLGTANTANDAQPAG